MNMDGLRDVVLRKFDMSSHSEAIDALKCLGLPSYEAKVFVGLQRIRRGSARDVDRVAHMPRSQIYGAAETLEERGVIDI